MRQPRFELTVQSNWLDIRIKFQTKGRLRYSFKFRLQTMIIDKAKIVGLMQTSSLVGSHAEGAHSSISNTLGRNGFRE